MVERRVAPRIILVKPSSWAKRTLASVKGPRMPSLGFHSAALTAAAATTAAAEVIRVRRVIALRLYVNFPESFSSDATLSGYGPKIAPEGDRSRPCTTG